MSWSLLNWTSRGRSARIRSYRIAEIQKKIQKTSERTGAEADYPIQRADIWKQALSHSMGLEQMDRLLRWCIFEVQAVHRSRNKHIHKWLQLTTFCISSDKETIRGYLWTIHFWPIVKEYETYYCTKCAMQQSSQLINKKRLKTKDMDHFGNLGMFSKAESFTLTCVSITTQEFSCR